MDRITARRRAALFALFLVPGLAISSWVTRTPDIRDAIQASTAEMGLVLFGLSVGSMAGILASGRLVARFGARPIVVAGMLGVIAAMPIVGLGAALGSPVVVTAGLAVFGLGMGGGEIAINVEGADVERIIGREVLPMMHGFFSLGTVLGAVAGIVFTATSVPVVWHLLGIGAVTAALFASVIRRLGPGVGQQVRVADAPRAPRPAVWRDPRVLLIGAVVLAMALAEGTANDWLPLVMVDGHGFDPALGSAVFAAFAESMTVGRFAGGPFLARFGRARVIQASAIIGGLGLAGVIFLDQPVLAGASVILWGLGASLGFPVALSAAVDSGPAHESAARVSFVAVVGYVAFLVGPPTLGFLGEHFGLRHALIAVLALVAVAAVLAPAVGRREPAKVSD